MLSTSFSVKGASLNLLRVGERGVVMRVGALPIAQTLQLQEMGIKPGRAISVEQQAPNFVVRVGGQRYPLNRALTNAIYVRILA
jgi:ferrous iron transport protein A